MRRHGSYRIIALGALLLLLLGGPATIALAVETRLWQLDTALQLEQGELDHVVLSSLGEIKLGRSASRISLDDVALVWSALETPDGSTYLGTGNNGAILRLRGAKVEEVARTESLVVSALALGEGGTIYAGTLPGGKIYRLEPKSKGKAKVFVALKRAEHIWALHFDTKRRVLFAATGPEGLVYAIQPSGRAEVFYETDDDHALSLLLTGPGGDLIVGTSPSARLLKVSGPGRAVALHDFDATEVKAIAGGENELYMAVNTFPEPPAPPKTTTTKLKTKTKTRRARPKPGKGKIFRRLADGSVEPLLEFDEGHLTSLEALDDGLVYAGTGAKGRIVAVDNDRVTYTIADVDERQVLALTLGGRDPILATGDAGAIYRLGKAASGLAEYRTPPLDAGFVARWGQLDVRGTGKLNVQTRSGNTEEPDRTWSSWSKASITARSKIASSPARYLQIRVRWNQDPSAVLRGLGAYYLANNQRPVVTEVDVDSPFVVVRPKVKAKARAATNPQPPKTAKGGKSKRNERSSIVKIGWKVDNPDGDSLRYRLYFREESEVPWRPILPSDKVLSSKDYRWNTGAVPAGRYLVKVEASDELDNPAPRVMRSEKISAPVVIDNQPPRVTTIVAKVRQITGRIVDGFSPIERIEYSLDGRQWLPVAPVDDIFDSRDESFRFELPSTLASGSYTVAVRAFDRAQNATTGRVVATLP